MKGRKRTEYAEKNKLIFLNIMLITQVVFIGDRLRWQWIPQDKYSEYKYNGLIEIERKTMSVF